jgi:sulfite reductase alpha subunit-like flavoprotein
MNHPHIFFFNFFGPSRTNIDIQKDGISNTLIDLSILSFKIPVFFFAQVCLTDKTMSSLATDYLILWASQTGNAEWIAKNIHTEAGKKGYTGECFVMDDFALVSQLIVIQV